MKLANLLESPEIKHIHFIGIGGISMSGLAEILKSLGYKITGSDEKSSNITKKLENMGIEVHIGHNSENLKNPDLVVYTAAVKHDNPEILEAERLGIPVIERATLLGQIMKKYPFSIAISGTHGKTTTTSMITMIMLEAELDPTVHIGGELDAIGGTIRIGGNKFFVTEACEYVESFLKFHPFLAVVLNIEADHLDYFKNIEHIKEAFLKFAALVPQDGYVVACIDDANVLSLLDKVSCRKITYGIKSENAMWSARNISFDVKGCASFTLLVNREAVSQVKLNVPGVHNVSNALAAAAACYTAGCGMDAILKGLSKFYGAHKRFEFKGIVNNIRVIDDYAHHPTEIKATLKAARNINQSKIWCVFQPHTYTRTKLLLDEFSTAFADADVVIVSDIYAAREKDTGEIHSSTLVEKLKASGKKAFYIPDFEAIADYLRTNVSPGELVITMGAGDICRVGEIYLKKLNE